MSILLRVLCLTTNTQAAIDNQQMMLDSGSKRPILAQLCAKGLTDNQLCVINNYQNKSWLGGSE
ncbi:MULTISPECIES: hypothetical protein [Psychrobacter]|uniref:Secreted protein n=1 Tax=Psychrobacter communis TaxID=2762238 RepID=A0ABR8RJY9_9GAMM|nr:MULTISPECIES: hypothetical protein [Psychrobacter]MBD7948058.1 hypothetical protein [Psychrobacter communis]TSB23024.1 hypothetical protein FOR85_07510 [Psychrobacter sp. YGAH215]